MGRKMMHHLRPEGRADDPRDAHKSLYASFLRTITRHLNNSVHRVHQVFPSEIKKGLQSLSLGMAEHVQIGAYASMQALMGRRHPTVAGLMWGDVTLIKTAAMVEVEGSTKLVHAFAVVLRLMNEKVMDRHGLRLAVFDPSGDQNYLVECRLVRLGGTPTAHDRRFAGILPHVFPICDPRSRRVTMCRGWPPCWALFCRRTWSRARSARRS